jgi:hypothetical protein
MTQPAENPTKTPTKPSLLPLILAALAGGVVAFILSQFRFSMWIEPPSRQNAPPVIRTNPTATNPTTTDSAAQKTTASSKTQTKTSAPAAPSVIVPAVKNGLRVSNQSSNTLRVVLLSHQSSKSSQSKSSQSAKRDRRPAHWDFAPSEGSQKGLLLSLPSEKLTLKPGDVLMAFATDGSRRYWGPYIVGETATPTQTRSTLEWQLVLRP